MPDESAKVAPAVLERLRLRFRILDTDGNGYLEEKDFDRLAAEVLGAMGEPEGSAKGQAVLAGHRRFWSGLRAALDADRDGRVSLDEYIAGLGDPGDAERTAADYAASLAALADRDDDGYIERDDFLACMTALGFARSNSATLFETLDEAGDGRVPVGRWTSTIMDYYRSERTDVPVHVLTRPASDA
ncbi:EF-hand domain-containing protein [Actinomadura miaoliensis]|uniref:EF-hand domain-containing protein n=1 Tax=Actinomadura miaoliensis TaxID=430685 RepID=A0ABP7X2R9_9ACTN